MVRSRAARSGAVETISDARDNLTVHVARFRQEGVEAEPVILGNRREPEAVLLPYQSFVMLMDIAEDIAIGERIREREATDSGERISLGALADELGIDLEQL